MLASYVSRAKAVLRDAGSHSHIRQEALSCICSIILVLVVPHPRGKQVKSTGVYAYMAKEGLSGQFWACIARVPNFLLAWEVLPTDINQLRLKVTNRML